MIVNAIPHQYTILLVAKRSRFNDSLRAIMKSMPEVNTVLQSADGLSLLKQPTKEEVHLVVLDITLPWACLHSTLSFIRESSTLIKSLVLIENEHQRLPMMNAGADAVLVKGFQPDSLSKAMRDLLSNPASYPDKQE